MHFTAAEIRAGIDPWLLIDRTLSYRVPDHYLQWIVSNNLFGGLILETGFNPDGKQMWSAGDRPVLIGLLEATFSQITNFRSISLYYLRVIFFASLLIPVLNGLLHDEFSIAKRWQRAAILIALSAQPFFLTNFIFTWPKMAGLAFGMMGFSLAAQAGREGSRRAAVAAGVAFGLGSICHTAAIFCLGAAVGYQALACIFWRTNFFSQNRDAAQFWRRSVPNLRLSLLLVLPFLVVTQIHSRLLARVTNQTQLLQRVQFCRGGSYAFVTPRETLFKSCKKYFKRQGIEGAIADRRESFRRAFDFSVSATLSNYLGLFRGDGALGSFLSELRGKALLSVPLAYGRLSAAMALGLLILQAFRWRFKKISLERSALLTPIGFGLLCIFACMLGEYTEMSAHVVPYVIPLFIQLGVMVELARTSQLGFAIFFVCSLLISAGTEIARYGIL